jgi:hypothetical protein
MDGLAPRRNEVRGKRNIRGMVRTLAANTARGWCFGSGIASLSVYDLGMTTRQTSRPVVIQPSAARNSVGCMRVVRVIKIPGILVLPN